MDNKLCEHKLRKLYYRRAVRGKKDMKWVIIPNKMICVKCKDIKEIK